MKIRYCSLIVCLFTGLLSYAQVAFNTTGVAPDNSAMLDVASTAKGILVPRMTTAARTAIASPAIGLLVYDNSLLRFYYYNGTSWVPIAPLTNGWSIKGNSGTVSGTNFLGTTDNQALDIKTRNILHTRIRTNGQIEILNTGGSIFLGENVGLQDDLNNHYNIGIGTFVMTGSTSATGITSIGYSSSQLAMNTAGYNTTIGSFAVGNAYNDGDFNTAFGRSALVSQTSGNYNTALGAQAAMGQTTGSYNVVMGNYSMYWNVSGSENVAVGYGSLYTTTGNYNLGIGTYAQTSTGNNNIALGRFADVATNSNTATAIGYSAGATESNTMVRGDDFSSNIVKTGVGTATPLSNLDIIGTAGMTVKSGQVAGTNNPDNTASVWLYISGTGTITLPAATDCANRIYTIVNGTGAAVNISSYNNLAGAAQTTQPSGTSMMIVSNGTAWLRIR